MAKRRAAEPKNKTAPPKTPIYTNYDNDDDNDGFEMVKARESKPRHEPPTDETSSAALTSASEQVDTSSSKKSSIEEGGLPSTTASKYHQYANNTKGYQNHAKTNLTPSNKQAIVNPEMPSSH